MSYNALLSVIWDLMRIFHLKRENEKRQIAAQENVRPKGTGNKYGHSITNFLKTFCCTR